MDPLLPVRGLSVRDGSAELSTAAGPSILDPSSLRHIPSGNFFYAQGCLVVVGGDEVSAFVPRSR